ncbi:type II secretion system F family protein [Patescibacteria group bacterium]
MKKFKFKAKNAEGKVVKGLVEAINEKEAARILRDKKLILFNLAVRSKTNFGSFFSSFMGVSSKDVAEFTRQLATMIASGLSLTNSLILIQEQSKPAFEKVLADVVKEVEGGSTLHDSLSRHPNVFTKTYVALIKSGEFSGGLDDVLKRMADTLEKEQEFKGKVKGAMIYPIIVIIGMFAVIAIMMVYVVPKLMSMYEEFGTTLPLSTQILISSSNFATKFWYLVLLMLGGIVYGFHMWRKTPAGRKHVDKMVLKIPIFGVLTTKIILTDVARTLSMLLGAGVTIIDSLNIAAEASNNAIYEESMRVAAKDVEKGLPLTTTFERYEEYPPIFAQMIAVGEETGKLDDVLAKVAKQFEMEAELAVKGLTTAIEPLMMVILGVGVGFIIISIITPIYNLTSQF